MDLHKAMLHNPSKQNTKFTYNGITSKSPVQKAELLDLYFSLVFTRPNVNMNEKEDKYEEISNVTDIADIAES